MNKLTKAKIALFLIALGFIAAGMRSDNPTLRWIGIAFLVVAFALRFIPKQESPE
jgi:hypothetical protein